MTTWSELLRPGSSSVYFDREPKPVLDPAAGGYDPAAAWWLAELSRLVYRHDVEETSTPPRPTRREILERAGLRQIRFIASKRTCTLAWIVAFENAAARALVFRGTEQNASNLRCHLRTGMIGMAGKEGRVQSGYLDALDSVWPEVEAEICSAKGPVWYAGHSLGGALATLAAARRAPRALYTFGSQRVGDASFAESMRAVPAHRLVHGRDPFITVPFESLGYRHVGALHALERPVAVSSRSWLARLIDPPPPFADHAPIEYTRAIEAELSRRSG